MNDLLEPPPPREIPADVREDLRARLRAGMAEPARSRTIGRPAAVAAAVTLLAGGAFVVTSSVHDGERTAQPPLTAPAPAGTLDLDKANTALDRCWAALREHGKDTGVPERSTWVPVLTESRAQLTVVGATAGDKPFFCETTATTVTMTDPGLPPAYAKGQRTGTLLTSPRGVVAGVTEPDKPGLRVSGRSVQGSFAMDATSRAGLFAVLTDTRPSTVELVASRPGGQASEPQPGQTEPRPGEVPLLAAPRPLVSFADRPVVPAPDRTSERGRFLGDCLAGSERPVVDPDAYVPGAMVSVDSARVVVSRSGDRFGYCVRTLAQSTPERAMAYEAGELTIIGEDPVRAYDLGRLRAERDYGSTASGVAVVGGVLPAGGASMTVRLGATTLTPDVREGTWAVALPDARTLGLDPAAEPRTSIPAAVTVRDAQDRVIFEGSVDLPAML